MSEMMLVTGGARSGKSSFAEKEATKYNRVLYVATGIAFQNDTEFQARIKNIKQRVQNTGILLKHLKGLLLIWSEMEINMM